MASSPRTEDEPLDPASSIFRPPSPHSSNADDDDDDGDGDARLSVTPRQIVRLLQCRICSLPLRCPVYLPCGETLCRTCQPEPHPREGVSFPGTPERRLGFECPFKECAVEHALADCGTDVVLEGVLDHARAVLEKRADVGTRGEDDGRILTPFGKALLSIYARAKAGDLTYHDAGADPTPEDPEPVTDNEGPVLVDSPGLSGSSAPDSASDGKGCVLLADIMAGTRPEMDCNVCYALFHDPVTTTCGHTYCRSCLHRSLEIHPSCPICRRTLSAHSYHRRSSSPPNGRLARVLESFWPDQVRARSDAEAERASSANECDTPIFVCTVSLPTMPTVLHVFETRYRLMIQRALQGDRTFGMVLPLNRKERDGMPFTEVGTMLRIKNLRMFPDGRSLLEAVGVSRFRIVRYSELDDYVVAKVERYDDVSIAEEEAIEAAETRGPSATPSPMPSSSSTIGSTPPNAGTPPLPRNATTHPEGPSAEPTHTERSHPRTIAYDDIDNLPTATLLSYALATSGSKIRRLTHPSRGSPPTDPLMFPWWLASALPTQESAKYRLLRAVSVRERLKICCRWLTELEEGAANEGYVFPWLLVHTLVVLVSMLFIWALGGSGADRAA